MTCTICQSAAQPHCQALVLDKYTVQYYQCSQCQFIFTEPPYWLDEAYAASAITRLDIGSVQHNYLMAGVTQAVIMTWLDSRAKFIDYGGGYGMLVRHMRDRGFDFYRHDRYCQNLFANSFDLTDVPPFHAELITAFEVMEHLPDPVDTVAEMLGMTDTILFSTAVQPRPDVTPATWWYFHPQAGQHIALYSRASLYALASRFGLHYCWNKQNIHLFSRKPVSSALFRGVTHPRLTSIVNKIRTHPPSLLLTDYNRLAAQISGQPGQ